MTFEEKLKRIEDISEQLSGDDVPLEMAMKLYDESVGLIAECNKKLEEAQTEYTTLSAKAAPQKND